MSSIHLAGERSFVYAAMMKLSEISALISASFSTRRTMESGRKKFLRSRSKTERDVVNGE
jgi:hypothetical protein